MLAQEPLGPQRLAVESMRVAIKRITGYMPLGCPWYAMTDPLIPQIIQAATLADQGLGHLAFDSDDPPALLVDALDVYLRARTVTYAHDNENEHKARQAKYAKTDK